MDPSRWQPGHRRVVIELTGMLVIVLVFGLVVALMYLLGSC